MEHPRATKPTPDPFLSETGFCKADLESNCAELGVGEGRLAGCLADAMMKYELEGGGECVRV